MLQDCRNATRSDAPFDVVAGKGWGLGEALTLTRKHFIHGTDLITNWILVASGHHRIVGHEISSRVGIQFIFMLRSSEKSNEDLDLSNPEKTPAGAERIVHYFFCGARAEP